MKPGVAGVNAALVEETMREVQGVPVVVRVRPMTALEVHRIWQCFTFTGRRVQLLKPAVTRFAYRGWRS